MCLLHRDLCRGAVGYLESRVLRDEPDLLCYGSPVTRNGPFVCLGLHRDELLWAEMTSKHRFDRLFVDVSWRIGGSKLFQTGDQFMNGTLYRGIPDLFLTAGERVHKSWTPNRPPMITDVGVERIEQWLRQRHPDAFE